MNKVFSILQCVFFLALSALVSCNPMESEDDVLFKRQNVENIIEVSNLREISEGFKPAILFRGVLLRSDSKSNNLLFDGEGKDLGTLEDFMVILMRT